MLPLASLGVERLRGHLLETGQMHDAVLVSILPYAGLRPSEALALAWTHVRERSSGPPPIFRPA